jgi:uncharacterized protein (DUF2267 family)
MTTASLDVFDRTLHETNEWLKDLMYEMGWEDRHLAYKSLRAALHALRDRLTPEEAAHLSAQMPMLVRGLYYEGWKPSDAPEKIRDKESFLARVKEKLDGATTAGQMDIEMLTRAVFKLVRHRISEGEVDDIISELPKEIAELWPRKVKPEP